MKRELLRIISDCAVDPVSVILAFARAGETDWTPRCCPVWFLYDFADATIISVPEWQVESLKRALCGDAVHGVVHAKVAFR